MDTNRTQICVPTTHLDNYLSQQAFDGMGYLCPMHITIHTDGAARGIADGDLVRAFNDRGSVILVARLTERVPAGVVHSYESCADYEPAGAPGESPDLAGCVNILTPKRFITPTSTGMANNSCLIQVERWQAS